MAVPVGPFNVNPEDATDVSNFVDTVLAASFSELYGGFVSLTDPILSSNEIDSIVAYTFSCLKEPCAHLMEMLMYNKKIGQRRRGHLRKTFQLVVVYNLFSLLRVRNNQLFVLWAAIATSETAFLD